MLNVVESVSYIYRSTISGWSQGSSVSIVSGYGLDDRRSRFDPQQRQEVFSYNPCVQTSSEVHPASCPVGTGGPFPGVKAQPERNADHSPPSSVEVKNEQELYLLSPLRLHRCVVGLLYFTYYVYLENEEGVRRVAA
jgi:hypothetical protein